MANYSDLIKETGSKLLKAIDHLQYSYDKVQTLPDAVSQMDDEMMGTWESFSSRFSRVSDIFIMQYIRTKIAIEEPGFRGSTRDYLNKAEKFKLINNAREWLTIRELRNVAVHEYNDEDLTAFYRKLKSLCPVLLMIRNTITEQANENYG